jgi:hypothetical protein
MANTAILPVTKLKKRHWVNMMKLTKVEQQLFALGMAATRSNQQNAAQVICEALEEMQRLRRTIERMKKNRKSAKK